MTKAILFLCMALVLAGCRSATVSPSATPVFKNWQECFQFMRRDVDDVLTHDDNSLFKLAAESSMEWFGLQDGTDKIVCVIKLDSLNGPDSALRGVQGNGPYYLFTPIGRGFQFVGRMEGNGYRWSTVNRQARFTTSWHKSASDSYENIYDWDGKMFKQTSHVLYRCDPDGSCKEITEPNPTSPRTATP